MSEELPKISVQGSRLRVDINLALIIVGVIAALGMILGWADDHFQKVNDIRYVQKEQYDKDQRNVAEDLKDIKNDLKTILYSVKPFRTATTLDTRHEYKP